MPPLAVTGRPLNVLTGEDLLAGGGGVVSTCFFPPSPLASSLSRFNCSYSSKSDIFREIRVNFWLSIFSCGTGLHRLLPNVKRQSGNETRSHDPLVTSYRHFAVFIKFNHNYKLEFRPGDSQDCFSLLRGRWLK